MFIKIENHIINLDTVTDVVEDGDYTIFHLLNEDKVEIIGNHLFSVWDWICTLEEERKEV